MKKYKLLLILFLLVLITGCKKDNLEGIEIVTTAYPYEYITNELYGTHSLVISLYPDATNTKTYKINNKTIKDYSTKELFIYNGLSDDKDIAAKMLNYNKDLLIIDGTKYGFENTYTNGEDELWLNPSNLLMIAQNVRNGLNEYISNSYLKREIDENYESLKVRLSELDAEIKLTAENATRKTIVVNSDTLKYLEKYGFEVISLDSTTNPISEKTIDTVNALIKKEQVKHIILLENEKNSDELKSIIKATNIETLKFRRLDSISDSERDNNEDYISIMNSNIELLKSELY